MDTSNVFNSRPMSAYDSASQPKGDMNNIPGVTLASIQERIIPRQVTTGNNRGELTIKGLIRVVDTNQTIRLVMGYKKDAF